MKLLRNTLGAISLVLLSSSSALAAQELVILTDQTQLMTIAGNPGTVVVGNPSIADATVHGSKIFVHGRAHGTTNMIILDQDGNQISSFDISVQVRQNNAVAVFKSGNRYSYDCAPLCETTVEVGDEHTWTDEVIKLYEKKAAWASGAGTTQQAAPPPPAQ